MDARAQEGVDGNLMGLELAYLSRLAETALRLEDAETAKDSLRRWLKKIPGKWDWLDWPLDILDELLKIASGRGNGPESEQDVAGH